MQASKIKCRTGMQEPSSFGRSLAFGRVVGALAVLHSHGRIDEAAGKALMRASGGAGLQFERLWVRLTTAPVDTARHVRTA